MHVTEPREKATILPGERLCYLCTGQEVELRLLREANKQMAARKRAEYLRRKTSGTPLARRFDQSLVYSTGRWHA